MLITMDRMIFNDLFVKQTFVSAFRYVCGLWLSIRSFCAQFGYFLIFTLEDTKWVIYQCQFFYLYGQRTLVHCTLESAGLNNIEFCISVFFFSRTTILLILILFFLFFFLWAKVCHRPNNNHVCYLFSVD